MGDGSLAANQRRFLTRLRQSALKLAARLLAFELRVIAAIAAGFAIAFVVAALAGLLTGLTLGALKLSHCVELATLIIQVSAVAVWLLTSFKVYRYLKQRSASP